MIRSRVHFELPVHRVAQLRFGQHAADGLFHQPHRLALADVLGALLAQAALVAAVPAVNLLQFLAAGQLDLRRVDDNDMVARVDERRVDGLVLALQQPGCHRRHAAEHLPARIDYMPPRPGILRAGHKRPHQSETLPLSAE